jgi:hypothetical protein
MDQFSYLSVLLSIILGLAITQVLKGFRGILLTRARIRFYWPPIVWSLTLLLIFVQSWWAMFGMRHVSNWTFPPFAIVVLQTILEYMLAAIVLPDFFGNGTVDLKDHYYGHSRWFFGLTVVLLAVSLGKTVVVEGHLAEPADAGFQIGFLVMSLMAIATRNEWFHKVQAVLALLGVSAYVLVLFMRLH